MSVHVQSHIWKSTHVTYQNEHLKLSPVQKLLMVYLADNSNADGHCYALGAARMVRETGLNERTVRRSLHQLASWGVITIQPHESNGTHNRNTFQFHLATLTWGHKTPTTGGTKPPPLGAQNPHHWGHETPTINQVLKPNTNQQHHQDADAENDPGKLASELAKIGVEIDHVGAQNLWQLCQASAPNITVAEICQFALAKIRRAGVGRIRNRAGFLIRVLPEALTPALLLEHRASQERAKRESADTHELQARIQNAVRLAHEAAAHRMTLPEDSERDALIESFTSTVQHSSKPHPGWSEQDIRREARRLTQEALYEREFISRLPVTSTH